MLLRELFEGSLIFLAVSAYLGEVIAKDEGVGDHGLESGLKEPDHAQEGSHKPLVYERDIFSDIDFKGHVVGKGTEGGFVEDCTQHPPKLAPEDRRVMCERRALAVLRRGFLNQHLYVLPGVAGVLRGYAVHIGSRQARRFWWIFRGT